MTVRYHPDGGLFVGDLVSFEVIAPDAQDLTDHEALVEIMDGLGLGPAAFRPFGILGRWQATLLWEWDTAGLDPGRYLLTFKVEPEGPEWQEYVYLQAESELPPPEPQAQWAVAESECCLIHYMTGTEADRDLDWLMSEADHQAELAIQRMGGEFTEPIVVTLLPRVLGHGGFAGREISVSYLDRNYAGSLFEMVLHHEMIHILDQRLGGELRPTIFVEGIAVYWTGGHYKPEVLMPRAAALLELPAHEDYPGPGWYLPLEGLIDDFYLSQHEIGYLQAGALVEYMVERWGWEPFSDFYRDILPHDSGSQARAIDEALQRRFDISLTELEADFLNTLLTETVTPDLIDDVRLTVTYYEILRRYQKDLDPSAYFLTAWLLDNEEMRRRGIVADYLRSPDAPENVSLETLFVAASDHLVAGNYIESERYLRVIQAALEAYLEPIHEWELIFP
jgi:hypothetical protein